MKNTIATDNLGVIAALVRDRDWSQTALGDRRSWSSELQAAVQILVDELDRDSDRTNPIDADAMPDVFSPVVCEEDRRYDALFDSIDRGFSVCEMIFDADGKAVDYRFLEINPMFAEMTGLENAEGRTARELVPDLEEFWFQTYGNVVATGQSIRFENQAVPLERWFDVYAFPIASNQSRNRFGILFADITDRKRKELNARFLSEIQDDLATLADPQEILGIVGEKIRGFFGCSLLTFSYIDVAANTARNFYNHRDADILDTVATHDISDYLSDAHIERIKTGEIIAIDDVSNDPDIRDGGAAYSTYQIHSIINVPYLSKGEWKFLMSGSRRDRSIWRADELELMYELINRIYPRIERGLAETVLQEKVLELQALLDIIPVGIAVAEDPNWEVVRVNSFAQEVLSVAPDILAVGDRARESNRSLPFRMYRNGREIDGSESPLQLASKGVPIKDLEIQIVRDDGVSQDWLINAIPLLDRFGQVRGSVAAIADVTKLKQTEVDLRQIEEFKNRILENSPDCIQLLDSDGKILYMNERGISSLEIDDFSEYLHGQYLDFWQDEHRTEAEAALIKAKRGETAQFCGYSPTTKGDPKWWEVIIAPIPNADNQIQQLLVNSRDISDRYCKELNERFLSEIQRDLVFLSNPTEIMDVVGEKVRAFFGFSQLIFINVDAVTRRSKIVYNNLDAGAVDGVAEYYLPDYLSERCLERLNAGQIVAIADVNNDANVVNGGAAYIPYDVRSEVLVPHLSDGKWKFMLGGNRREPSTWRSDELELIDELTARIYLRIERAHAELALRDRVADLQAVLDVVPVGIAIAKDANCNVVHVNRFAREMLSVAPDTNVSATGVEAESLPFRQMRNGNEILGQELPMQLASALGTAIKDVEIQMVRADGITWDWLVNAIPLFDEAGMVRGSIAAIADVTNIKQAENALRQSEEFKNRMLDSSPDCIKVLNLEGQILYMNTGGMALLEIDDFSLYLNNEWLGFWQGEYWQRAEQAFIKAKEGEITQFCGYCPTAKGTPKWWEVIISPIKDVNARVRQLLVSSRDISDRHRQELNNNFLTEIQKDLVEFDDPTQIMSLVGEKIRVFFNFSIMTFTEVDDDADTARVIYNNRESDVLDAVYTHSLSDYLSPTHLANLSNGQSVAIADVTTDPDIKDGGAAYTPFQVRSVICVPCLSEGLVKLYISGCRREPSHWRADELILMQELVERIYLRIERARKATALKLINQRFETVMRSVKGIIFEWDLISDSVYRSESLYQLTGIRARDAAPTKEWWLERIHPEDIPHIEATFANFTINTHRYQSEYRVRHEDGRWIDVWEQGNIERNAEGEIVKLIGFTSDISDRKYAERRLRESERIYRAIGETLDYGIWINDPNGQNIYASPSFLKMLGITQEECTGLDWSKYLHPDACDRTVRAWLECVRTEGNWSIEHRFLGVDGNYHSVLARGVPVRDDRGEIICWAGINLDISELKQTEQLLRQSEERLRFTIESTQTATWDIDLITNKAIWSKQHFTMLGYEPLETGEATYEMWECRIHPDDRERVRQEWQQSEREHRLYRCEYRICRADNNQIAWLSATGSFTYDDGGRTIRSIGVILDISDRKFAEEALFFSRQRMDLVLNSVELGVWYCNLPFDVLEWNDNCKQHFGLPPEATVTIDLFYELIHPSDRLRVRQEIAASIENYTTYDINYRTVAPDGQIRWIRAIGRGFYDASGNPTRFDGVTINVTDLKRTESALKQSEERLRLTIEGTQVGTWDQDIQNNRLFWSDRMFQIFGYEPHPTGEASIETWNNCLHPDDAESVRQQWQRCLETCNSAQMEFRIVRADNQETRWVEVMGSFVCDIKGQASRSTGVIFDISDRKFTETALVQSEERYRNLVELIPQLVWIATPEGSLLDVNQRWLDFTGLTLDRAKSEGWETVVYTDDIPTLTQQWELAQTEGKYQAKGRMLGADGRYLWHLHQAIPIKNDRGEITKWFGTATDIDEIAKLEAQSASLLSQLQERNQELDHFSHIVSHDLKAPLRAIANLSQWLEDDIADLIPEENQEQLKLMRSRVFRMEALIDGLLNYARVAREHILPEPVAIGDLLAEIIDSLAPPATFTVAIAPFLPTFTTKRILLIQVLANLIGNGIKHHGRADGTINISVVEAGEFYRFNITDDGQGIDPKQQSRIFDIFQTLSSDKKSTGIGLAIVKKIVETEGGEIQLTSEIGKGSTFSFTWRK